MEAKKFWEVIPDLSVNNELRKILEHVFIERVSTREDRSILRIYIRSDQLIPKKYIYQLQGEIKKQLFPNRRLTIMIQEKFYLPADLTAGRIFELYKDSILLELKNYSLIEYNLLRQADCEFISENVLSVTLANDIVLEARVKELARVVEKVMNERCCREVDVRIFYRERRTGFAGEQEAIIKRRAMEIAGQIELQAEKKKENADSDKKNGYSKGSGYGKKPVYYKKAQFNHNDVLFGRDFDGEPIALDMIKGEMGEVVVAGEVIAIERRELRTGNFIIAFDVTDYKDTITVKIFAKPDRIDELDAVITRGAFLKVKGLTNTDKFDNELVISSVVGIRKHVDNRVKRMDYSEEKRVELHCHTKMSDMDGITEVKSLLNRAKEWGHTAIAITDHGCVQAFPEALHCLKKDDPLKIIYGVEGYLADDDDFPEKAPENHQPPSESYFAALKKKQRFHIIILAKNETGRLNLYRLISDSHINYFYRRPIIPRSLLNQYREGLILGSACEAGELFRAVVAKRPEEDIERIARFYDYLEIQPIGNNAYMIPDGRFPDVKSEEDLRDLNRYIVSLADRLKMPCVATCDVHFLNPADSIYRSIIMASKGFKDASNQPPLFYRTTEEMMEEFDYLGLMKAKEVVVTNTNLISDMCERISPISPEKCPPVIENSDRDLREICYTKARTIYGEKLPEVVENRLERELNSIISNGYAVMYIIAQKLVWKSNEDGYLVGSRGSVGSSLAATMAGITEVNPLSPHYYCPACHYSDFDSEEVKSFSGGAGCDMPDKNCLVCGALLKKDGFDIPFETFLGFKGDKEPDIDLNFSGEYQAKAHAYTEEIFGEGHTFKAGTIGTLADKTAYGMVMKYFDETEGAVKRRCEINRLIAGCVGIRRTTGQHPGGIVVLPYGKEIYSFTPIQRPANDMTSDIRTTHFDYHSIDGNLLKLDILGHDDPTMIRMLTDLTGIEAQDIPLDNKEVMTLFKDTSALGISPADIGGCELGALGIPEFGTDFAMEMLKDTKPKYFSDLVRIAGLAHGTDVWLGNAKDLIVGGTATIQTAICTRDDIMVYLIGQGLDSSMAFTIMESVRKGKGLKPEWEEEMLKHQVPLWYIDSCKKIKYMFPKAHAAAYVMMAWRIAYCKIFYPLAYYASFFSIRADSFSYELMCLGRERLNENLADYRRRADNLTNKEQDSLRIMRIVEEMYARGFEFMPLDIYRAKATRFQIIDGKIMPAFNTIDGLGDKAAEAIEAASKNGKFLSEEDFIQRTKASKTIVETMSVMGIFGNIPKTNQITLFDFI